MKEKMNPMKSLSISVLLLVMVGVLFLRAGDTSPGEFEAHWLTDMDLAVEKAGKENKKILVDFSGSDWCYYCKKIDAEVFTQKAFVEYAKENLVLLLIDFPRKKELPVEEQEKNQALASKFNVRGFPTLILLGSDGSFIKELAYNGGGEEAFLSAL